MQVLKQTSTNPTSQIRKQLKPKKNTQIKIYAKISNQKVPNKRYLCSKIQNQHNITPLPIQPINSNIQSHNSQSVIISKTHEKAKQQHYNKPTTSCKANAQTNQTSQLKYITTI